MNIAVYCSSSNRIDDKYLTTATRLGEWIATNGHTLVFGGATGGSMTAVSEGAASRGGTIHGIVPDAVVRMGRESQLCTELITVATMDERKRLMKQKADAFVILPGSYGTLDEFFDVVASGVVGEHKKPVILLNENGFYDYLLLQTKKMKDEQFIPVDNFRYAVVGSVDELVALLK